MAQALKKKFPKLQIAGNENGKFRIGSFELTLDGKLLFSKLDAHRFPTAEEAAKLIQKNA